MENRSTPTSSNTNPEANEPSIDDIYPSGDYNPYNSAGERTSNDTAVNAVNGVTEALSDGDDAVEAANGVADSLSGESESDANDEPTREEEVAKVWLEGVKNFRNDVSQNLVVPSMNKVGSQLDKVRNVKDKSIKRGLLLERRVTAAQRKSSKLEAKLAGMNPNSMRYRRLSKKRGKLNIKLGQNQARLTKLDTAISERVKNRKEMNEARELKIFKRREMLYVAKRVAFERKERRKLSDKARWGFGRAEAKAQLEERIRTEGTIDKFQSNLLKQVNRRAEQAIKNAKAAEENE